MIAIIGTSDRPCWLAEACKIILLLLIIYTASTMQPIQEQLLWHAQQQHRISDQTSIMSKHCTV